MHDEFGAAHTPLPNREIRDLRIVSVAQTTLVAEALALVVSAPTPVARTIVRAVRHMSGRRSVNSGHRIRHERIVAPLSAEARERVVARQEPHVVAEREQIAADRPDQRRVVAAREIRATD